MRAADPMRSPAFAVLALLAFGVAAYALVVYGFLPIGTMLHPDMRATYAADPLPVYAHVFASVFALALGPLQFSRRVRAERPRLHRWSGRLYLAVGVLVGGVSGLVIAFRAYGGPVAQTGFACLALAWLATGVCAYRAIRAADVAAHRRWMVRNFALAYGAVTLRLWLPGAVASGVPFETAYPLVAWLCWVPNVLVAEWLLRGPSPRGGTGGDG